MSFDFSYDEELDAQIRREHKEILGMEEEGIPASLSGADWLEKVYAGEVDLPVGFAYDEHNILVGHGQKTKDTCGSFGHPKTKFLIGCLRLKNHAKVIPDVINPKSGKMVNYTGKVVVKRVFYNCGKPECPACYLRGWAVRSARRAELRLKVAQKQLKHKVWHLILSPPQSDSISYEKLRELTMQALMNRGVIGGCIVYHHFRYRNPEVAKRTGLPVGWYRAPHFHVLGIIKGGYGNCHNCSNCYLTKKGSHKVINPKVCEGCNGFESVTRRLNKQDGCICVVMDERQTIGGTLWYELSHASLRRDKKIKQVINWFGVLGKNKFKLPKGKMPQYAHLCPICGEKLYKVRPCGMNAPYADLLRFMSGFKHSAIFLFDGKACDGSWLWEAVYDESGGKAKRDG